MMICPVCGDEVGDFDGREHMHKKHGVLLTCSVEMIKKEPDKS
jgi:hypothetical protein